jgi:hypothetical protein
VEKISFCLPSCSPNVPNNEFVECDDNGGSWRRDSQTGCSWSWLVDGEKSSMRRGVVAFEYSSAQNGDFSLNRTSRFRTRAARDYHMEIGAIAYQRISVSGLSMVNAEFDLQVHSHLHVESLTRTTLYIAPLYTLF